MKSVVQQIALALFLVVCTLAFVKSSASESFTFSNTNLITINDFPTNSIPYPSSITVTGLTGLFTKKITVQLNGFSHTFPDDVDMLLVGPSGQNTIFFSNVGGGCDASNISITLDDQASLPLLNSCLSSGTFHPTNRLSGDSFPSPAPTPGGASDFGVFKGTDPNGEWQLYATDDTSPDSGSIAGGWSVTISVSVPLQIQVFETNAVISWPAAAQDWLLQSSTSLGALSTWSSVSTPSPVEVAGRLVVTNALTSGSKFYRLVQ